MHYLSLFLGGYEVIEIVNSTRDGLILELGCADAFKRELKIPIMISGIHDPDRAAEAVASGQADMVLVTRPLLADPDWAAKALSGQGNTINKCDRENACVVRLFKGLPVRCARNPDFGWERNAPLTLPGF